VARNGVPCRLYSAAKTYRFSSCILVAVLGRIFKKETELSSFIKTERQRLRKGG